MQCVGEGGITWCFLRPIYFCLGGVEAILSNSNFYQRDHPASSLRHSAIMTLASSDNLVCTDEVCVLLVQKCDNRCKTWSAPDCVRVFLEQAISLSAFAVALAGLASLILLMKARSLQGLFLQLWPLKLPGALDVHL